MEKARVLKLADAIQYNRQRVWLEMRETDGEILPVTFHGERGIFLQFDCEDRVLMFEVRAEYYGKTWRCWSAEPNGQKVPNWKD